MSVDPSKPNDPRVDYGQPIPRPRTAGDEVLEGEIIDRGVPVGRPGPSAPPPPQPKKPAPTRRTILWTLVGIAAFLCLGGLVTTYVWYNKAAEPDRGNPTATLRQYLDARFNSRDVARANVFACQSPKLSAVDDAIQEVEQREQRFQIRIRMFTTEMTVTSQTDSSATVRVEITVEIPEEGNQRSGEVHTWEFGMVQTAGWRVCSATQES